MNVELSALKSALKVYKDQRRAPIDEISALI
jgi:hypothetical protein